MTTIDRIRNLAGVLDPILRYMSDRERDPERPFVGGYPDSNNYLPVFIDSAMGNSAIWDAISEMVLQVELVIGEMSDDYNKARSQNPEAESLLAKLYSRDIYTADDLENMFQDVAGEMSEGDRKIVEMAKIYGCYCAYELEDRLVQADHCDEYEEVIGEHDVECGPDSLDEALNRLDDLPDLDDIRDRISEIIDYLDCIRDDINC